MSKKKKKARLQVWHRPWFIPAAVFAVAWLHRFFFLLSNRDASWPFTVFYFGDTRLFYEEALDLLRGLPLEQGVPFHPPLFVYLLSILYRVTGVDAAVGTVDHLLIKSLMAALGSTAMVFLYLALRRRFDLGYALFGTALATYHFGMYVTSIAPVGDAFFGFLLLGLIWHMDRALHPGWRTAALHGVVMAAMILTRAESLLMCLLLCGLYRTRGWRYFGTLAAGAFFTILPWTIRNYMTLSQYNRSHAASLAEPLPTLVPITLYGKINLAMANHPAADGSFNLENLSDLAQRDTLDLGDPQHLNLLLHGHRRAIAFWRDHPVQALKLVWRKWGLMADCLSLGWTQWNLPGGLNGKRRPVDVFTPDRKWGLMVLPLLVWGWVLLYRDGGERRRWALLIGGLVGCQMIAAGLFFGYARLGLLILPLLLSVVPRVFDWLSSKTMWRPPKGWWLVMLGVLFLVELGASFGSRNFEATGTTLPNSQHLNQDDTVTLRQIARE